MEMYNETFMEFFKNHKESDFKIETSPMVDNVYYKHYIFDDGAIWYERTDYVVEKATAECKGIQFTVDVKLQRTEYFSSDDAKSRYFYCKA